ncbi:MAG: 16S rRNA (cytidine(1402)-2'-O)-methyltransferase [Opitutales bacterium]
MKSQPPPETKQPDSAPASAGVLYVVATPIGNLSDVTRRAESILKECDVIACEDSRITRRLLNRLGIEATTLSYHEHNEKERAPYLALLIEEGKQIALVSDAGTPTLSDPGFRLVRECRRRGLRVIPIPGPSAVITALSASGLPTNAFFFAGFLPPKTAARQRFFTTYREFPYTICLYESPHRIEKCVRDIVSALGPDRTITVCKELTKIHEKFVTGRSEDVQRTLQVMSLKGEFVVLIAPGGYEL